MMEEAGGRGRREKDTVLNYLLLLLLVLVLFLLFRNW